MTVPCFCPLFLFLEPAIQVKCVRSMVSAVAVSGFPRRRNRNAACDPASGRCAGSIRHVRRTNRRGPRPNGMYQTGGGSWSPAGDSPDRTRNHKPLVSRIGSIVPSSGFNTTSHIQVSAISHEGFKSLSAQNRLLRRRQPTKPKPSRPAARAKVEGSGTAAAAVVSTMLEPAS